ncbi:DNA polymerase III subunit gamma and tau [Brachybacterium endophyticum]|uniref:DNA-directed DNA polymerase n=1 Tax=Brachybacterium endophyticum TaxID=2182385 RepID=A0A2U2RK92_9MICO|nr:DNA polymerase III subunit gamma and tau [Brachybacterium endophyticum]PWH06299.1 DNA polymerase III subunit gamma and tau [Brachybacterium endophyticum]
MVTALYRRYRPESFAEVIGQDHVTVPLMRALRNGRVGHAYLFSGPRGCGKTTSARILARCLNCVEGPTDSPCGQCDSCRDLARGGPGSLDVVEIDAASHGGVDDARELRERATFAPARDRYKVFIIDEAHMVTSAGFNALLKLVEEPPEHVKFVFATTEPDKVIGTIRSRTHHYPFRLIPPQVLTPYLEQVCEAEGVQVGEGVLPLVVRAGGGSARDTLSVLDQLMAGAGEEGVDYTTAISLLGFTDTSLLDESITAIGRRDAGTLYRAVERVLETGHEPRRFVEDLLERLRDLIVLAAVPERGHELLPQTPADELERMREQVSWFPVADLSLSGDLVNQALSTMSGATSPRLHLELLAARLLLRGQQVQSAPVAGAAPAGGAGGGAGGSAGATAGGGDAAPGAPRGAAAARAALPRSNGSQNSGAEARWGTGTQQQTDPRSSQGRSTQDRSAQGQAAQGRSAQTEPTSDPQTRSSASVGPDSTGAPDAAGAPSSATASSASGAPSAATASASSAADDDWGPIAAIPGSTPRGGTTGPAADPSGTRAEGSGGGSGDGSAAPGLAPAADAAPAPTPTSAPQGQRGQASTSEDQAPPQSGPTSDVSTAAPGDGGGQSGGDGAQQVRENWSAILDALQQIRRPAWALVSQHASVASLNDSQLTISFRSSGLLNAFGRGTGAENLAQAVRKILHMDVTVQAVVDENPSDDSSSSGSDGGPAGGGPAGRGPDGGGPSGGGPSSGGPGGGGPAAGGTSVGAGNDGGRSGGAGDRTAAPDAPAPTGAADGRGASSRPATERPAPAGSPRGNAQGPGAAAPRPEDFPPEPDDDPYPPEPEDAYPPDPQDAAPSAPRSAPSGNVVDSSDLPGGSGLRGQEPASAASAPEPVADSPTESPAQRVDASGDAAGEVLEVHDEGRDSVPDGEPRTHGQAALKLAIAQGRTVRSLPPLRAAEEQTEPSLGAAADDRPADGPDRPTGPAEPGDAGTDDVAPDLAAERDGDDESWSDGGPSGGGPAAAPSAAPAPSATSAPSATPAPSASPAPSATSASPAPSDQNPATRSTGAALAREAALASRGQQQTRRRGPAQDDPPEPPPEDEDPTGGATWYDEDVQVATRSGREIAETVLGGKVLEVIDETR